VGLQLASAPSLADDFTADYFKICLSTLLAAEYDQIDARTPGRRDKQTVMLQPLDCAAYSLTSSMIHVGKLGLPDAQIEQYRSTRKIQNLRQTHV
jgi:hypothetical protein